MTTMTPEEAQEWLARLGADIASDEFWTPWMEAGMEEVRRFAVSISPVATGAYRKAHRMAVDGKMVRMFIDPSARNAVSGASVTDYAGAVEARHRVYGRAAEQLNRLAVTLFRERVEDVE